MFLVSGITGHVGGSAARKLLDGGHSVRTLSRNPEKAAEWAKQGVEVRQGDFNNAADVADALQGVEGAFLMMPPVLIPSPDFSEAKAVIASYEEALRLSPPPRLVLLSSIGSEKSSRLGNITSTHLMEEALGSFPFPTAVVRAAGFLENYIPALDTVAATGVFNTFVQPTDQKFSMIATVDIGHEVAKLLAEGWDGKKIIELGSSISPDELAQAMGEALGRQVVAQPIPRENWAAVLEHMGFPPGQTGEYEQMWESFNSGWITFGIPGTESVAGTTTAAEVYAKARKA